MCVNVSVQICIAKRATFHRDDDFIHAKFKNKLKHTANQTDFISILLCSFSYQFNKEIL